MCVCESISPGSTVALRKIDDGRARRHLGARRVRDTLDAVAANHDHLIAPRLVGLAINQRAGANHGDGRRRSALTGVALTKSDSAKKNTRDHPNEELVHVDSPEHVVRVRRFDTRPCAQPRKPKLEWPDKVKAAP